MYSFGKVDRRSFSFASQDELLHAHKYIHMKQSTGKHKKIILDFLVVFRFGTWNAYKNTQNTKWHMHKKSPVCICCIFIDG